MPTALATRPKRQDAETDREVGITEAIGIAKVSRDTLYRNLRYGLLPARRGIGGLWVIRLSDLRAWMAEPRPTGIHLDFEPDTEQGTKVCAGPTHEQPTELPLTEFHRQRRGAAGASGRASVCKRCFRKLYGDRPRPSGRRARQGDG
jgi:Helix-turn-helix domain